MAEKAKKDEKVEKAYRKYVGKAGLSCPSLNGMMPVPQTIYEFESEKEAPLTKKWKASEKKEFVAAGKAASAEARGRHLRGLPARSAYKQGIAARERVEAAKKKLAPAGSK